MSGLRTPGGSATQLEPASNEAFHREVGAWGQGVSRQKESLLQGEEKQPSERGRPPISPLSCKVGLRRGILEPEPSADPRRRMTCDTTRGDARSSGRRAMWGLCVRSKSVAFFELEKYKTLALYQIIVFHPGSQKPGALALTTERCSGADRGSSSACARSPHRRLQRGAALAIKQL